MTAPAARRRGLLAWAAVLVPLWVMLALCCHWEPILRDGWGHFRWHRWTGLSLGALWKTTGINFHTGNPRLGQIVTILQYTPGPWHALFTPLLELSLFGLLTTLVLGRRPSLRRVDDALLFATVTAMIAVCAPAFGQMMFYRPYTGNYVFGLALQLAFLVPYRLRAETYEVSGERGWWWRAAAMFVLGVLAGLCNEHTGPAVGALGLFALVACWRQSTARTRLAVWMIAGLVGLALGWAILLLAPGQEHRYSGLAQQAGTLERITDRGLAGDASVLANTLRYILLAIPWGVLGLVARRRGGAPAVSRARRLTELAGVCAAAIVALTLLGSPKEGERLAFAACALAATAIAGWVTAQLAPGWSRWTCAALTALALGIVGERCLVTLHGMSVENADRLEAISTAPPGATVMVQRYTILHNRWTPGEDFENEHTRQFVANSYGLAEIDLAPASPVKVEP